MPDMEIKALNILRKLCFKYNVVAANGEFKRLLTLDDEDSFIKRIEKGVKSWTEELPMS